MTMGVDRWFLQHRWWPDMACAALDGLVETDDGRTSHGRDRVPTMPLLRGTEAFLDVGRVEYLCEGPDLSELHPALMVLIGKHVRVLRGSELVSESAPSVGIRYDGL